MPRFGSGYVEAVFRPFKIRSQTEKIEKSTWILAIL
jgi:hypothetical protein